MYILSIYLSLSYLSICHLCVCGQSFVWCGVVCVCVCHFVCGVCVCLSVCHLCVCVCVCVWCVFLSLWCVCLSFCVYVCGVCVCHYVYPSFLSFFFFLLPLHSSRLSCLLQSCQPCFFFLVLFFFPSLLSCSSSLESVMTRVSFILM